MRQICYTTIHLHSGGYGKLPPICSSLYHQFPVNRLTRAYGNITGNRCYKLLQLLQTRGKCHANPIAVIISTDGLPTRKDVLRPVHFSAAVPATRPTSRLSEVSPPTTPFVPTARHRRTPSMFPPSQEKPHNKTQVRRLLNEDRNVAARSR